MENRESENACGIRITCITVMTLSENVFQGPTDFSSTKNFLYDRDNEIGSSDAKIQELRIPAPSTTAEINASVTLEL